MDRLKKLQERAEKKKKQQREYYQQNSLACQGQIVPRSMDGRTEEEKEGKGLGVLSSHQNPDQEASDTWSLTRPRV